MTTEPSVRIRHKPVTQALHWLSFVCVSLAALAITLRAFIETSEDRKLLLALHESAGILVLALTLVRLIWRLVGGVGAVHSRFPRAARIGATGGHTMLYFTLIALTLLGWLTGNAFGQRPRLFGVWPLPALIERDRDLGDSLQAWHTDAAWVLLVLVLGHVTVALWHHFIWRDGVLTSMTPFRQASQIRTKK